MQQDEQQLVQAIQTGDRAALAELLERYQHRLYNVVLRMVSHRDDAAEVTQDALMKIVQHIDEFQGNSQVSTWMIRIAMNQAISHLRKRKLRYTTSLDYQTDNGQDQMSPLRAQLADQREPGPEERVQTNEMIGALHQALGNLAEDFRAVVVLRDIDQLDYQQIAQVLDVPVGTVKSRLFRARLALRQELTKSETLRMGTAGANARASRNDEKE